MPTLALCRSQVPELFLDWEAKLVFRLSHTEVPMLITNAEVKNIAATCRTDIDMMTGFELFLL